MTLRLLQTKENSDKRRFRGGFLENNSEIIIYQTQDGETKIDVRIDGDTVWLSLMQLSELFQRDKSVISRHIKNVFEEGELERSSTVAFFATVQDEGNRKVEREIEFYNLDVIISVGYRVKSLRGTQFRMWATKRLNEYIIKSFAMKDEFLNKADGVNYFDELLKIQFIIYCIKLTVKRGIY